MTTRSNPLNNALTADLIAAIENYLASETDAQSARRWGKVKREFNRPSITRYYKQYDHCGFVDDYVTWEERINS